MRNEFKKIPLHILHYAQDHRVEIANLLLAAGSEVNARDVVNKTPLHSILNYKVVDNSEIIFALIAQGAEIDPKDDFGATPLRRAIRYRNSIHVEILVSIGASMKKAKESTWMTYWFEKSMKDEIIIAAIELGKSTVGEKWQNELQKYHVATLQGIETRT